MLTLNFFTTPVILPSLILSPTNFFVPEENSGIHEAPGHSNHLSQLGRYTGPWKELCTFRKMSNLNLLIFVKASGLIHISTGSNGSNTMAFTTQSPCIQDTLGHASLIIRVKDKEQKI